MRRIELVAGDRFGKLTVLSQAQTEKGNFWRCMCDCGKVAIFKATSIRYGNNRSCGCLGIERIQKLNGPNKKRYRLPYPYAKRLIQIYEGMRYRCYSEESESWHRYGGRGIKICDEWLNDRHAFYKWASENGHRPDLTLDRIDVNGDYEPRNCRWVTRVVQSNNRGDNRVINFDGETHTMAEWARIKGLVPATLFWRLNSGWSVEKALTQPARKKSR